MLARGLELVATGVLLWVGRGRGGRVGTFGRVVGQIRLLTSRIQQVTGKTSN